MHSELRLVIGLPKTKGDTASAEQGMEVIDLMSEGVGFALDEWIPQIPGLKNDGVWADSMIATGRQLIAGEDSNVNETITVNLTAATHILLFNTLSNLMNYVSKVRQFWTTFYQVQPPCLHWKAVSAPRAQFAEIYNIDAAISYPDDCATPLADVTLTIERNPYWKPVRPGGNPKEWSYEFRGEQLAYDYSDARLWDGSDNLVQGSIYNSFSWSSFNNVGTQNFVDIPGSMIPGDVPALVALNAESAAPDACDPTTADGIAWTDLYVSRVSKPLTITRRANPGSTTQVDLKTFNILNAADGSLTGSAASNNACGAFPSAGLNRQIVTISTFSASLPRIVWGLSQQFDFARWRGRYAVFVRMRQVAGAQGDIEVWFGIGYQSSYDDVYTSRVVNPLAGTASPNTELRYIGELTLPPINRVPVTPDGVGIGAAILAAGEFRLYANRLTGAGTLIIYDVIFMPIDEQMARYHIDQGKAKISGAMQYVADNTRYLSHGQPEMTAFAGGEVTSGTAYYQVSAALESRGQDLTLEPGRTNRLYFLGDKTYINGTTPQSPLTATITVRVNIIPRWKGIIDR